MREKLCGNRDNHAPKTDINLHWNPGRFKLGGKSNPHAFIIDIFCDSLPSDIARIELQSVFRLNRNQTDLPQLLTRSVNIEIRSLMGLFF